ncbi:uncharacterized protein K02A2.6-like [Strongylocentrotus purpuratus]|uniref:Reverse transcriptase domain-containing protein n=1 Tax=Strongylocentrotus purpuratus TaxID=7668 RepID=A0A7M7HMP4_STRPU|nr:uncharacterized protein K02A2.6-like [Strongylocentrotus purpuratus]|eukprot:XP_011678692.1 PREDICTED: uncharacterized protein K02A2.6-like [Strongylocentrotus purpuratus]
MYGCHWYWGVDLDRESNLLTTFNALYGRYRYRRLPFGLNFSQDIFREKMDYILEQCEGTIGIADDVVVYGKNADEHDRNMVKLMNVSKEYGLVFNLEKCDCKIPSVKFFGCYYDAHVVHADPDIEASIRALPSSQNVRDLQRFLGMIQL